MRRHHLLPRLMARTAILLLVPAASASAQDLPAGEGREAVVATCTGCHGARYIPRAMGYDRDGWKALTGAMVDLSSDTETSNQILDYLATHFPPSGNRQSVTVDGPLVIDFQDWVVPTSGQRPRDPVEAPDGSIWWVGQWGDILGRLDPDTGTMTEFPLLAGAKPHSVTIGPDGDAWYTGNKNATIGRLDPATGEITEYPMPRDDARDPHTHVFDANGILWFTLQSSNMVGRLDPASGDVKLVEAPRPGSRPYGIKVAADGHLWVACNGANCLLQIDPNTMAVEEVVLPGEGTHVRRLDIDADGVIWWVNSGLGKLGRYDPNTGAIRQWASPSGPDSHPYALAIFDGAVWYNESGVRPDMLVRFDPKTETFQSWPIASGEIHAGILRHARVSRDGKSLLIHQTATNRIGKVSVRSTD